jgi:hypothetical protein
MMSNTLYRQYYSHYTYLSDSAERALMRDALSCGETVSMADLAKSVFSALKKASLAIARFTAYAIRSTDYDRTRDPRLSAF